MQPETYIFEDDGQIPNSKYPLLLYRKAFSETGSEGAVWLENHFAQNKWTNSWRNGVFSYHHFHSITHEVLGVYFGSALLHLGGEKGVKIEVSSGDIIVIPAGVGHKKLESSNNFAVTGAYPNGMEYDVRRGSLAERTKVLENISKVTIPEFDPFLGKQGGLIKLWT